MAPLAVPMEPLRDRDPRELGGFRMLGRLGYGGMGVAYLAQGSGDWAVVKVVRSDLSDSSTFRARLLRELEAMRRAEGPYTAALLASDVDADPAWFAMEYIPGSNLGRHVVDTGPLPAADLQAFAASLALALAHVHAAGVVHRDLKPSNIMMSPTGPRLIDFGIAGMEEGTNLTRAGSVVGSAGWLAPEQVTGDPISFATDIHAWGLCVLFAATSSPPFGADTSTAAMYRVLEATPEIPPEIPQPLRDLLTGAVAKDPAYRPPLDRLTTALATGSTGGWIPHHTTSSPPARTAPETRPVTPRTTDQGRSNWIKPAALAFGSAIAIAFVAAAAFGGTNGENGDSSRTPAPAQGASAGDSTKVTAFPSPTTATSPTSDPAPATSYAVKIEYAGSSIPDATFANTLEWTVDICSPDAALLTKSAASSVRLYTSQGGSWKRVAATATTIKGGRCGANEVNITIPHTESIPQESVPDWSTCQKFRVVLPETTSYRKSNVDLCVRTRAT
jgi:serine/threonine protein kinase